MFFLFSDVYPYLSDPENFRLQCLYWPSTTTLTYESLQTCIGLFIFTVASMTCSHPYPYPQRWFVSSFKTADVSKHKVGRRGALGAQRGRHGGARRVTLELEEWHWNATVSRNEVMDT